MSQIADMFTCAKGDGKERKVGAETEADGGATSGGPAGARSGQEPRWVKQIPPRVDDQHLPVREPNPHVAREAAQVGAEVEATRGHVPTVHTQTEGLDVPAAAAVPGPTTCPGRCGGPPGLDRVRGGGPPGAG